MVAKDDGPRASSTLEKLAQLEPAFRPDGKVTAGNSCPLNDGAAAVLVMSDSKANELGLTPRARIITAATAGIEPEIMGVGPIGAIKKVLDRAGMKIEDVDQVELNEAFAAQVIPIMDECDIPLEKMNPHGGAIALGHPFGMTGARIMTTLLNGLETDDKTHRPRDDVRGRRPGPGDDRRAARVSIGAQPAEPAASAQVDTGTGSRTKPAISSASRPGWSSEENVRASSIHSRRAFPRSRASARRGRA